MSAALERESQRLTSSLSAWVKLLMHVDQINAYLDYIASAGKHAWLLIRPLMTNGAL